MQKLPVPCPCFGALQPGTVAVGFPLPLLTRVLMQQHQDTGGTWAWPGTCRHSLSTHFGPVRVFTFLQQMQRYFLKYAFFVVVVLLVFWYIVT